MVFFEAPHRTADALSAMAGAFGPDRVAAVCRELTKTYEEVRRGSLDELVPWAAEGVRGEITIVVSGASAQAIEADLDDDALSRLVEEAVAGGLSRKDAVAEVAARTGVPRKRVYAAAHRTPPASA
jgi:16S rRNA (cytidine1402-2'-O)-methyltransferase